MLSIIFANYTGYKGLKSRVRKKYCVSKTVTGGSTEVRVSETTRKDGEVIEEKNYTIVFETPEDAWNAVHG